MGKHRIEARSLFGCLDQTIERFLRLPDYGEGAPRGKFRKIEDVAPFSFSGR